MTARISMAARSRLLLAALVAVGFAIVLLTRSFDTARPVAIEANAPVMQVQAVRNAHETPPAAAPKPAEAAPLAEAPRIAMAEDVSAVGEAEGAIHFEKKPAERDSKGESIDINVQSALGVWQPDGRVMRVLLLESQPPAGNVGEMLGAIQTGATNGLANRSAVLELRFVPTAQAFDRNELDSATLIVSDGKNTSSADALSSLDWRGSLPWPDPNLPTDRHPSFTLHSSNETISSARGTWKQSWRLTLNVPVIMR
jgi:hypothetical protein